eukprot:159815-Rhodomonas_salina.2
MLDKHEERSRDTCPRWRSVLPCAVARAPRSRRDGVWGLRLVQVKEMTEKLQHQYDQNSDSPRRNELKRKVLPHAPAPRVCCVLSAVMAACSHTNTPCDRPSTLLPLHDQC